MDTRQFFYKVKPIIGFLGAITLVCFIAAKSHQETRKEAQRIHDARNNDPRYKKMLEQYSEAKIFLDHFNDSIKAPKIYN